MENGKQIESLLPNMGGPFPGAKTSPGIEDNRKSTKVCFVFRLRQVLKPPTSPPYISPHPYLTYSDGADNSPLLPDQLISASTSHLGAPEAAFFTPFIWYSRRVHTWELRKLRFYPAHIWV